MIYQPYNTPLLNFTPTNTDTQNPHTQPIVETYQNALKNLLEINTVPCPLNEYNKTGLLSDDSLRMIRAGGGYHTPWTRDASLNTWNAACFLEPEVAKTTLLAVCERSDGKLYFQLDNQSWDKVVWACGAWQYYLATGDLEFLSTSYEIITNSVAILEKEQYNKTFGLFTGGSFFNDGITGYPKDLHEEANPSSFVGDHPAPTHIMALSTNCLYYETYCILEKMDSILSNGKHAEHFQGHAKALKYAINHYLWNEKTGRYSYFLYPDSSTTGKLHRDDSQEACGNSFAILFDVCDEFQARQILENCAVSERGIVSIWPPFPEISSIERPLRHNNLIWPFINGFFATAAAKHGFSKILEHELTQIAKLVSDSGGTFYEIYNPSTGKPDGGWQVGHNWDSVKDQTWSATGFIRMIVYGLFGITLHENHIDFKPCLPEKFGRVELRGIRLRDIQLDIILQGAGSKISKIWINKEAKHTISFALRGHYLVEIWMNS